MAFEVVPTAAGRLHSDQYTKIIIINTPINLSFPLGEGTIMWATSAVSTCMWATSAGRAQRSAQQYR